MNSGMACASLRGLNKFLHVVATHMSAHASNETLHGLRLPSRYDANQGYLSTSIAQSGHMIAQNVQPVHFSSLSGVADAG